MLIGLSHTPTAGSMLSNCINLGFSWRSTFLSEAIWRFRARFRIFSACFRTRQHARHTLSVRDGIMASSVLVGAHPVSLTVSPLAPAYSVVGSVAVASITVSARNTYKPISTNSPSASTAASTLSTPSVLCSASLAMSPRPRNLISTPQNPDLLHLVSVCDNPISTV